MELVTQPAAMTAWSEARRVEGGRVGLVPTMGFLHSGHASLMDALRPHVDHLVVSIYVNPLQFGAGEDLERYPRDPDGDAALCRAHGVDCVFQPDDLYPDGFATSVAVHGLSERLCGAERPGHFEGVCTVVARLFGLTRCDVAAFGEKDFQQLAVLRRMVADLALPTEIVGCPLVRDDDGMALSSRNVYLSATERVRGRSLFRALTAMADAAATGVVDTQRLLEVGRAQLDVDAVDYLEIVGADDLAPLTRLDRPARALVAAHVGATRLIDNAALVP